MGLDIGTHAQSRRETLKFRRNLGTSIGGLHVPTLFSDCRMGCCCRRFNWRNDRTRPQKSKARQNRQPQHFPIEGGSP